MKENKTADTSNKDQLIVLLNSLDALVYVADMETYEILFINDYGKKTWGDITGKICWQNLQNGQIGPCDFCTNKYLLNEDGTIGDGYTWDFKNTVTGKWFHITDRAINWYDGRIVRIEVATDITEHKHLEVSLLESRNLLKEAQEIAGLGSYLLDIPTGVWTSSDVLDRLFGIDDGYEHSVEKWTSLVHPDDRLMMQDYFTNEVVAKCKDFDKEYRIIRNDNQAERWVHGLGKLEFNAQGQPVKMLGTIQDITDRKKLEGQLRNAQKMEAIGTMAGGIAHDFNNLLAIIFGNADLARLTIPAGHPARNNIDKLFNAAVSAKNLVQQILSFTRQTDKTTKPINIIQAIEDSLALLHSIIPSSVTIHKKFELNEGFILADTTQFHQLMINLCTNAAQAMQEKGVLGVCLTEINITSNELPSWSEKKPGKYIRLSVSDTGQGMDHTIINQIFDPFFTTKEVGKGTGMGLSVIHGIMQSYGGFVTVESEPGKGSTFHLFFHKLEEIPVERKEIDDLLPTGNERILFVDDEIFIVETGCNILRSIGYSVRPVTSSSEALKIFSSQPNDFDLIITDMAMPVLTGKDLAIELLKIRPDIPIILCTGYSSMISKENAKEIGIREFCMKPLSMEQLAKTVRKVLDEK